MFFGASVRLLRQTIKSGSNYWMLSVRSCSSETGHVAAKEPFQVSLKPGKTYFWCRCGLSKKQPWCDGKHKGGSFTPIKFTVEAEEPEAFLCGCKQTGSSPYCDGTHASPSVQSK